MFKNRKTVNKIMYILAILMVLSMIVITLGPGLISTLNQ